MTVYRISNKIRPAKQENDEKHDINAQKCRLCLGNLDNQSQKSFASARNDLNFTQRLLEGSFGHPGCLVESTQIQSTDYLSQFSDSDLGLCYSCNIVMNEMKLNEDEKDEYLSELPGCYCASKLNTEEQIRDRLKDVLIEE